MTARFWTDFADGAVIFPIGVLVAVLLLVLRQGRTAWAWMACVGSVWAAILALKFAGYAFTDLVPASPLSAIDLVTPSGHVASATVIYGGLVGLLLPRSPTILARTVAAAILIAVGIGLTRILLHEHSIAEVVIGGVVGLAGAAALAKLADGPIERWAAVPVVALVAAVLLVRHGEHMTWEFTIYNVARQTAGALRNI